MRSGIYFTLSFLILLCVGACSSPETPEDQPETASPDIVGEWHTLPGSEVDRTLIFYPDTRVVIKRGDQISITNQVIEFGRYFRYDWRPDLDPHHLDIVLYNPDGTEFSRLTMIARFDDKDRLCIATRLNEVRPLHFEGEFGVQTIELSRNTSSVLSEMRLN